MQDGLKQRIRVGNRNVHLLRTVMALTLEDLLAKPMDLEVFNSTFNIYEISPF